MIKKNLILIFLISICSSAAFSKPLVISSVSDVIKRTRGENVRGFYNALLAKHIYTGMDLLFRELGPDIIFVSKGLDVFKGNFEDLFQRNNISYIDVHTKGLWSYPSDYAYKLNTLRRILKTTHEEVILIGDDEGVDENVYLQISKEFPERVEKIYLREIKGRVRESKLIQPFTDAYDLARKEYKAGRFPMSTLHDIALEITQEDKLHRIFPNKMECKSVLANMEGKEEHPSLLTMTEQVQTQIYNYCDGK